MRWTLLFTLALAACNTPRTPGGPGDNGIRWIEDDYARAVAEARQAGKPLVIDAWAPWCHTCISMRSFVMGDRALAPLASHFVWAAIDTEKPESAAFLAKIPVTAWPTFYVVDPKDESVKGRWLGSATVGQIRAWLSESERRVRAGGESVLAQADAAAMRGEWARAAELYGQAEQRPEVMVSRVEALKKANDLDGCLAYAKDGMAKTGDTQSAIDFAAYALDCADAKNDDGVRRLVEARLAQVLADKNAPVAADDKGAAYQILWDLRARLGDQAGARRAAEDLLRDLGAAADAAPDAYAASTFNFARAMAYLYLSRGKEAIAMLEKSEQALPDDYNPPHQLARVYRELKRWDEALAALDRSLAKAYGPRKGGLLGLRADLLEQKGDLAAAAAAYDAQAAFIESLPAEQRLPERRAKARENAARLRKTASAATTPPATL